MKQLNYYQDMTKATDTQPTDALSIADELLVPVEGYPEPTRLEVMAAENLRAQHRQILILEQSCRNIETERQDKLDALEKQQACDMARDEYHADIIARFAAIVEADEALMRRVEAAMSKGSLGDNTIEYARCINQLRERLEAK